jgi:SAM-dependent methyltransferase
MFNWYTHLCNYHNVTPEEALKLGTRASGRKPNLPGNEKCPAISNMTFEDIWEMKKRKKTSAIFDFYRDQGSWSTFRQCVRHRDLEGLHKSIFNLLISNGFIKNHSHICEYGCGVAPFTTTFLKYLNADGINLNFTLTDVDCDHFDFANYRLNEIVKAKKISDAINLNFEVIKPNKLPAFGNKNLDVLICFEVLEHVPSPIDVINNVKDNMNTGGIYVENFIKHEGKEEDGPDLLTARNERDQYYEIVNKYFNLIYPSKEESIKNPNCTRIWQRN